MTAARETQPVAASAMEEEDPLMASQVRKLMTEGMTHFKKKEYSESSAKFLKVLNINPNDASATRMGYISCEFMVIDHIRRKVKAQAADEASKLEQKQKALEMTDEALSTSRGLAEALTVVKEALDFLPDDEALTESKTQLKKKPANLFLKTKKRSF